MVEPHDVDSIEQQVIALTAAALRAAKERADRESALADVRARLEAAIEALPEAEAFAKRKRQERHDAVRGRTELEHRLTDLIEIEETARTRRIQAEQRAQSFRAATSFASAQRAEAERAGNLERADRERRVEAKAQLECASAESRAAEELMAEGRVARERAELERHVRAEREVEVGLIAERDAAERRVLELRATIEHAQADVEAISSEIRRCEAQNALVAHKRIQAEGRLIEVRRRARAEVETRIADLREAELRVRREREEHERMLAALAEGEARSERERAEFERAERERLEVERRAREADAMPAAHAADGSDDDAAVPAPPAASDPVRLAAPSAEELASTPRTPTSPAAPAPSADPLSATSTTPSSSADPLTTSRVTGNPNDAAQTTARPALVPAPVPAANPALRQAPRNPDGPPMRTLFSIFGRKREVAEPAPEPEQSGPSIADRIARDFGLLGTRDAAAASDAVAAPKLAEGT